MDFFVVPVVACAFDKKLHRDPGNQPPAQELEEVYLKEFCAEERENDAEHHGHAGAQYDALEPLFAFERAHGQCDHYCVVA